jgi:hypothetical protein
MAAFKLLPIMEIISPVISASSACKLGSGSSDSNQTTSIIASFQRLPAAGAASQYYVPERRKSGHFEHAATA